jgi:hypothetical protein
LPVDRNDIRMPGEHITAISFRSERRKKIGFCFARIIGEAAARAGALQNLLRVFDQLEIGISACRVKGDQPLDGIDDLLTAH